MLRPTSIVTPVAHLRGPGKIKVVNGRLAFSTGKGTPTRLDPGSLRTVLCYGHVGVSHEAMSLLLKNAIDVAWMTPAGHQCNGRLVRADACHAGLRTRQHQVALDPRWQLSQARCIVTGKIESQITAARHYQRQGCAAATPSIPLLRAAFDRCASADSLDTVRGAEGSGAAVWFTLFGKLLHSPWTFTTRVRRPPTDPVNALLSLGYTWLLNRTVARIEAAGLDAGIGALHEFRAGRPSLACDLIEPLRVPTVDRWVIQSLNRNLLKPTDFTTVEGGVRLVPAVFSHVISSWEEHLAEVTGERSLELAIQALIQSIRQAFDEPPTPRATPPDGDFQANY
jgi:CRISPR-associated protein Cas1